MARELVVDDEVFKALQERAIPLVDSPNAVIRRLLGLPEDVEPLTQTKVDGDGQPTRRTVSLRSGRARRPTRTRARTKRNRAPAGVLLPEVEYEIPILQTLAELGGRAPTRELLEALEPKLRDKLRDLDWERLASGDVRWKNRAQFVRLKLVRSGEMRKDSPRGTWEISDQGRLRAEAKR